MNYLVTIFFVIFNPIFSYAASSDYNFTVQANRNEVSLSDEVILNFVIEMKSSGSVGEPEYKIPVLKSDSEDKKAFSVINKMSSTSQISSYDSVNGLSTVRKYRLTHILKPMAEGDWTISEVKIKLGSEYKTASNIRIRVLKSSSTQSNSNSSQYKKSKNDSEQGANKNLVFLKTEIEKNTAFKGEQVIVNYYLYYATKVYNVEYGKFPVFVGFLKEDLDIPLLGNRNFSSEVVEYNGEKYNRTLLARYAAYPLQEGQLQIDPLEVRVSYQTAAQNDLMDDDNPLFSFFHQMAPRVVQVKSDPYILQIKSLPKEGQPSSFTGGIGKFDIIAEADKMNVKVNEGITLNLQVQGQGNISSVQEPKLSLPQSLELYSTKGKIKKSNKEAESKVFEFLIIAREPGEYDIPSIELSFYDPIQRIYYSRFTSPIKLKVEGVANNLVQPLKDKDVSVHLTKQVLNEDKNLLSKSLKKFPSLDESSFLPPFWRIFYWLFFLSLIFFLGVLIKIYSGQIFKKNPQNKLKSKNSFDSIRYIIHKDMSWEEILNGYEKLEFLILEALEFLTQKNLKSFSRRELKELALESKITIQEWDEVEKLLEDCDWVKFANAGNDQIKNDAKQRLKKWLEQPPSIAKFL